MEINEYRPKQNRLHKAASEYEASQIKAPNIKTSARSQKPVQINKNENPIIRGEIIDLRYQEVKIRLEPSGQIINGKLSGDVPLSIGQTAEFVISDETDGQITLRYIPTGGSPMNDIIHKALYASGLTASERNIAIVQELLNYQMPVDKNTILQLIKFTSAYPDVSPASLILMHKNNLPINSGSIAQFEAYQKGMHQILNQLKTLTDNINDIAVDNNIRLNNHHSSDIITVNQETSEEMVSGSNNTQYADVPSESVYSDNHTEGVIILHRELLNIIADGKSIPEQIYPDTSIAHVIPDNELKQLKEMLITDINKSSYYSSDTAEHIISRLSNGTMTLESLLSVVYDLFGSEASQPVIDNYAPIYSIVKAFIGMSGKLSEDAKDKLVHLLKSEAYRETISEALHSRWTLSPDELANKDKVKEFYRRLDKDMEKLDKLTDNFRMSISPDFKSSINKLQDNLQFMRMLNEMFLYVQLPIRLAGRDAHGDLYVFTRKHHKHTDSEGLNVLLHLDMTNLGPLDIHISVKNRQINAVFYVEKSSEQIISKHLNELIDALNSKGYQLQVKTQISDSKPDFITDILQQDVSDPNMHRYTFDIRA